MSAAALTQLALTELGADAPTTATVMRVAARLAASVNSWPGLRGSEKQQVVLSTLREVLTSEAIRSRMEPAAHATLLATLDTVVPETLALVVAAGRGEIDVRKPTIGCVGRVAALVCRAVAVAAPLSEDERRALGLAANAVSEAANVAEAAAAVPSSPVAEPAVPTPEKEPATDAAAADPTATDNKTESVTPATPTESPPSA
jgi:hypothetical protein